MAWPPHLAGENRATLQPMGWRKVDPMVWAAIYAVVMPLLVALAATPALLPAIAKDGAAWTQAIGSVVAIAVSGASSYLVLKHGERERKAEVNDGLRTERLKALAIYSSVLSLLASSARMLEERCTVGGVWVTAETMEGMRLMLLQFDVAATQDTSFIANAARLPGVLGDHVATLRRATAKFSGKDDSKIVLPSGYFSTQPQDMRDQAHRLLERLEKFVQAHRLPHPTEILEPAGL